jgi:hypothetical protein
MRKVKFDKKNEPKKTYSTRRSKLFATTTQIKKKEKYNFLTLFSIHSDVSPNMNNFPIYIELKIN